MNYLSENLKLKVTEKYKKNTLRRLDSFLRFCYKKIEKELITFDLQDIIDNFDKLSNALDQLAVSSSNTYMGYLLMMFTLEDKKFPEIIDNKMKELKQKNKTRESVLHEQERANIDVKDVYKSLEKLIDKEKKTSHSRAMRFLMISILIDVPLRLNEFMSTLQWEDHKINNYVDLVDKKIIIRKHKVDKSKVGKKRN